MTSTPHEPDSGSGQPHEPDVAGVELSMAELQLRIAEDYERERRLAHIFETIVQGLYLEEVLDEIFESFHTLIPYDRMGCALLNHDRTQLVARWGRSDDLQLRLKPGFAAHVAGSSLEQVLTSGEPRIIDDLAEYFRLHPDSKSTRLIIAEGIRSSLICPLIANGIPVGVLFFSSLEPRTYDATHEEAFLRLASVVSILVEKSRLYEELALLNQELTEARDLLKERATHDDLTGIWNRAAILAHLDTRLKQAARQRRALAVAMIDIDHFKSVNDTYGHQVGDEVLRGVAVTIQGVLRAGDEIGRYGGEEFLVVAEVADRSEAVGLAQRLRATVEVLRFGDEDRQISATVSIGVAKARPQRHDTPRELIRRADAALYEAKHAGRNCVILAGD